MIAKPTNDALRDFADDARIVDQQAMPRAGWRSGRGRGRDRLLGFRWDTGTADGRRAPQPLDQTVNGCDSLLLRTWLAAATTAWSASVMRT